jgi:hypothetical protein
MSDIGTGTMGIVLWMRRNKRSKRAAGEGSGIWLFPLFLFTVGAAASRRFSFPISDVHRYAESMTRTATDAAMRTELVTMYRILVNGDVFVTGCDCDYCSKAKVVVEACPIAAELSKRDETDTGAPK